MITHFHSITEAIVTLGVLMLILLVAAIFSKETRKELIETWKRL